LAQGARRRNLTFQLARPASQAASVRAQLTALLSHVMPVAQVDGWLAELIDGRFIPAGTADLASMPSNAPC